jgi:hypothetical protein
MPLKTTGNDPYYIGPQLSHITQPKQPKTAQQQHRKISILPIRVLPMPIRVLPKPGQTHTRNAHSHTRIARSLAQLIRVSPVSYAYATRNNTPLRVPPETNLRSKCHLSLPYA